MGCKKRECTAYLEPPFIAGEPVWGVGELSGNGGCGSVPKWLHHSQAWCSESWIEWRVFGFWWDIATGEAKISDEVWGEETAPGLCFRWESSVCSSHSTLQVGPNLLICECFHVGLFSSVVFEIDSADLKVPYVYMISGIQWVFSLVRHVVGSLEDVIFLILVVIIRKSTLKKNYICLFLYLLYFVFVNRVKLDGLWIRMPAIFITLIQLIFSLGCLYKVVVEQCYLVTRLQQLETWVCVSMNWLVVNWGWWFQNKGKNLEGCAVVYGLLWNAILGTASLCILLIDANYRLTTVS